MNGVTVVGTIFHYFKKKMKLVIWCLVSSLLILFSFQNCSPNGFFVKNEIQENVEAISSTINEAPKNIKAASPKNSEWYLGSSSVGNISGRAFADPVSNAVLPHQKMFWAVWGATNAGVKQPITDWNLGDFTGAKAPSPLSSYQVGYNPDHYGGTAVEMHDESDGNIVYPVFGAMMNTGDFPYATDKYHNLEANLSYNFSPSNKEPESKIFPFSHGPSSVLHFSFMLQIPTAYVKNGAAAILGPELTFTDASYINPITKHPQYFWFPLNIFKSGTTNGINRESVTWDLGSNASIVGSYFGPNTKFCTTDKASSLSTGTPWRGWRWFGYSISYSQFQAAVKALNKYCTDNRKCHKFSTRPEDYNVGMALIDAEINWPKPTSFGNMGYSAYGFNLYSRF
jgi:hypothetical protein